MGEQETDFEKAMVEGHSAAWEQDWARAAECYSAALAIRPDDPQALSSYGLAMIELKDYDQALISYRQAAEASSGDPLPVEKIAQLYEQMGNKARSIQTSMQAAELYLKNRDAAKAIENWVRITLLDPENLPARSRLALVHERLGNIPQAVSEYLAIASVMQAQGSPDKARQAIERALKIAPGNAEAQAYLNMLKDYKPLPRPAAIQAAATPEITSAQSMLEMDGSPTQELDPVSQACQKALTLLAGMLFETEDEAGSAASSKGLRKLVSNAPAKLFRSKDPARIRLHLSKVIDFQTRNEYVQASDELQLAMEAGLDHPSASFDLGYLFSCCDRPQDAIRHLQASAKEAEFAFGSHLLLGELLRRQGKTFDASQEYLQALKAADLQLSPRAHAAALARQYDRLIGSYRSRDTAAVQEKLCNNIQALLSRRDWSLQLQQVRQQQPGYQPGDAPTPLIDMLLEANSSQVVVSISAINEMIDRGQVGSAMEEALYTLRLAPTYLPVHSLIGELMVKTGDIERAVSKFQVISRLYAARDEMEQAIQYSRRVVELDPTNLDVRKTLIGQLMTANQIEKAVEETIHLAEVHYKLADLSTARSTYLDAIQMSKQTSAGPAVQVQMLHRIADIDMQSLEWRQALGNLEQITQLAPDDQKAHAEIVRLKLRLGQEQQAMAHVDEYAAHLAGKNRLAHLVPFLLGLVEEYPDLIPLRRRLADACAGVGKIVEAVTQLDIIGETMMQTGDRTGAIQTIEKIISLSPPNKPEYQALLNQLKKS